MAVTVHGHPQPIAAASAVLFHGDGVLLVERASGPGAGRWSLPGGHIEDGETPEAAARREVFEETAVAAGLLDPFGVYDVHIPAHGAVAERLYRITVFLGLALDANPIAGSDASAARFVEVGELSSMPLTEGALSLIRRAHAHVRATIARQA